MIYQEIYEEVREEYPQVTLVQVEGVCIQMRRAEGMGKTMILPDVSQMIWDKYKEKVHDSVEYS